MLASLLYPTNCHNVLNFATSLLYFHFLLRFQIWWHHWKAPEIVELQKVCERKPSCEGKIVITFTGFIAFGVTLQWKSSSKTFKIYISLQMFNSTLNPTAEQNSKDSPSTYWSIQVWTSATIHIQPLFFIGKMYNLWILLGNYWLITCISWLSSWF